ncbi:MAG: hypothetical protein LBE79_07085 [Tannerella sp.]|jgi:hypothetical protein|nr:hypothetical protein [Tannerella sp.]
MSAAELYSKTFQGYLSILPVVNITLSTYCKYQKVNYSGLRSWMCEHKLSIPKLSNRPSASSLSISSFAPLTMLSCPEPSSGQLPSFPTAPLHESMLKDVEIALPNGVQVSIGQISGKDMTVLIEKLNPN